MARTELFSARGVRLEWQHDRDNGWYVIAWRPHVSAICCSRRELLAFVRWPAKTPTGDAIRDWIDGLIASTEPSPPPPADAPDRP